MSAQPKTTTCLPFMTMASNRDLCARTLAQGKQPVVSRISPGHFDPTSNKIKVMTMKVNKCLEFPVVALPVVGHIPATGEDERKRRGCFMWRRLGLRKIFLLVHQVTGSLLENSRRIPKPNIQNITQNQKLKIK